MIELFQKYQIVRRVLVLWMMLLTTYVFWWAIDFATNTTKSGAEVGLMIGAITGPLSLLQGYVFKMYNEARSQEAQE